MKKKRTPQDKKRLSYAKDRRNIYGENDKSSRKAIRFRKTWVNQAYRRTIKQIVNSSVETPDTEFENVDNKTKELRRKVWKKVPDRPLGEYLKIKKKRQRNRF